MGVDGDVRAALAGLGAEPLHARSHVVGQPVLRQAHERLGGQADVADAVHVEQGADEGLQPGPRQVGHVPAGNHHVPHPRGGPQVVDHRSEAVGRGQPELELAGRRRGVADQVHPGAVAAVLRAGGQHLGEHLGRVPVGEALHGPHLRLVQRVAGRVRMGRPVRAPVAEHRDHVAAHRVGVEGLGEARLAGRIRGGHRVEHLGWHQHGHGGPLTLVTVEVGEESLVQSGAEDLAELAQVLHAMRPLPLG